MESAYHCNEIAGVRGLDLALTLDIHGGASALLKGRRMTIRGERGELWCGGGEFSGPLGLFRRMVVCGYIVCINVCSVPVYMSMSMSMSMSIHMHLLLVLLRNILLSSGGRRPLVSGGGIPLIHAEHPLSPLLALPEPIDAIFARPVLDVAQLSAYEAQKLHVLGKRLDALEGCDDGEQDVALGVHVAAQKEVFTQVVDGEVVFELHGDGAHERVVFHIWLVGHGCHGAGGEGVRVRVEDVHVCLDGVGGWEDAWVRH